MPGPWQSGPWGRWITQRAQHTQGLLLMPRNVPQQNAHVRHRWLESKQIHYLPFIHQLTTCLADTRDMPFLLLFIFNFSIFNTTEMHTSGYTIKEDFKPSLALGKLLCYLPSTNLIVLKTANETNNTVHTDDYMSYTELPVLWIPSYLHTNPLNVPKNNYFWLKTNYFDYFIKKKNSPYQEVFSIQRIEKR